MCLRSGLRDARMCVFLSGHSSFYLFINLLSSFPLLSVNEWMKEWRKEWVIEWRRNHERFFFKNCLPKGAALCGGFVCPLSKVFPPFHHFHHLLLLLCTISSNSSMINNPSASVEKTPQNNSILKKKMWGVMFLSNGTHLRFFFYKKIPSFQTAWFPLLHERAVITKSQINK